MTSNSKSWPTKALKLTALAALMIWIESYRLERYLAFINPWKDPLGDGFQIIQSLYAFGSGGLTGVGLGLSKQKFFYLPAALRWPALPFWGSVAILGIIATTLLAVGLKHGLPHLGKEAAASPLVKDSMLMKHFAELEKTARLLMDTAPER